MLNDKANQPAYIPTRENNNTSTTEKTHQWRCQGCGKFVYEYPCNHCGYTDNK